MQLGQILISIVYLDCLAYLTYSKKNNKRTNIKFKYLKNLISIFLFYVGIVQIFISQNLYVFIVLHLSHTEIVGLKPKNTKIMTNIAFNSVKIYLDYNFRIFDIMNETFFLKLLSLELRRSEMGPIPLFFSTL